MKTKNFELTFAKIYPNFTKKLLKISDELTSVEIKICMFLKMNYSSSNIEAIKREGYNVIFFKTLEVKPS